MYIKFLPVFFEVDFQHDNTLKKLYVDVPHRRHSEFVVYCVKCYGDRMINNNI